MKFLLVLFLLLLSACTSDQPQLPHLMPDSTIVAFGDSLTFGTGASQDDSYPVVLEKLIGFHVINAGVPGETTEKSLERLPEILQKYKPALVILCIGGNDMLHRVPVETIAENLKKLISLIQSSGASVALIAVPSVSIIVSVPDFYETVANEYHIPVDTKLLRRLLTTLDYKSDPLHLNKAGYDAFAKGIAAFLKKQGAIN